MSAMSIESLELGDEEADKKATSQAELQKNYSERIDFFHTSYQNSQLKNDHKFVSSEVQPITAADVQQGMVGWCY